MHLVHAHEIFGPFDLYFSMASILFLFCSFEYPMSIAIPKERGPGVLESVFVCRFDAFNMNCTLQIWRRIETDHEHQISAGIVSTNYVFEMPTCLVFPFEHLANQLH